MTGKALSQRCLARNVQLQDGQEVWRLISQSGNLDVNSAYCYIMLSDYFSDTCFVAEIDGSMAGFVSAFLVPGDSERLFVWQMVVDRAHQGRGIAGVLLQKLLACSKCQQVRYIETTVTASNAASLRVFEKLAADLEAPKVVAEGYSAHLFPGQSHEDEQLIRIGPLRSIMNTGNGRNA